MANITKAGSKIIAYKSTRGAVLDAGATTTANSWYEVLNVGQSSALPAGMVSGSIFKSPDISGVQIVLASGDSVYPLTLEQMFKTDSEISAEEGTIDVTDDGVFRFSSSILDGYKTLSGTLNGFAKVDDSTGVLAADTQAVLGRFFDTVTDDGAGTYTYTAAENEKFTMFFCVNKDARAGGVQNWLIFPVLLSSLGTGAGLKDAQKRDLSWTKAEGPASLYKRTAFDADVI